MSQSKKKPSGFSEANKELSKKTTLRNNPALIKEKQALELFQRGQFKESEIIYREIISRGTNSYGAYANLAQLCAMQSKSDEVIDLLREAVRINPKYVAGYFNLGNTLQVKGNLKSAISSYKKAIQIDPSLYDAHFNLAISFKADGDLNQAINTYKNAIKLKPEIPDAYINLAIILKEKGDLNNAINYYEKAIKLKPNNPEAFNNLGIAFHAKNAINDAINSYRIAIKLKPDYADPYYNLGLLLKSEGDLNEAINLYEKAIKLKPEYPEAYNNLGEAFQASEKTNSAISSYEKAIKLKPNYPEAHYNLGISFHKNGDCIAAMTSYLNAIKLKPNYAAAYNNLGNALIDNGECKAAIASYKEAIQLEPECIDGYHNLGVALEREGALIEAIEAHKKVIDIDNNYLSSIGNIARLQRYICDWIDFKNNEIWYMKKTISSGSIHPRDIQYLIDNPKIDLEIAKTYYNKNFSKPEEKIKPSRKEKIRIGYFSADFREHPVAMLLTRVLEIHDRSEFEIYAYAFGPLEEDQYTNRIKRGVDTYRDIRKLTDQEIVDIARNDEIDIAIDLMGYTNYCRTPIFSIRVAPIQINYLGFSGTMGANCIDYIIADEILIPKSEEQLYTEKVLHMPESAICCDDTLNINYNKKNRKDFKLPEDGFIFTCFNNSYKISPIEFDIWMNLLKRVEGSYLWLKISNDKAKTNLIKEAHSRNISSDRLIFAEFVPFNEHLERHSQGDLFLDTHNYNAGSTAVVTLMARMPLLTLRGNSYHSRMSASLLSSLGLEELISSNKIEYEEKAYMLATQPEKLKILKDKLNKAIISSKTFDSFCFTKSLEKKYKEVYEINFN